MYANQDLDDMQSASRDSQEGAVHPSFIPEIDTIDLKAVRMLINPKTKQENDALSRVSDYLQQYNSNIRSIQTS